ncbi:kelch-like protein 3 [Acyrthosiphon pisum]|uniref:Uncharacterized protein n=1 Tax=Acyrthosiphon pisum TaxID=7029 RepID=A0A8R2H6I0_ACYPI|nr:kelch-like protein 3 [Acyrthosiphon pisum]|eukprot:XP_016662124.1 PREDICTED: kelch-like protein 3 [Acyrthosiphon pisum]
MFINFDISYEYYDPGLDTWTSVAPTSAHHHSVGVGVLDGLMYAIVGYDGKYLKIVEVCRPSDGDWSSVADMEIRRMRPGEVALDGLLYVIGEEVFIHYKYYRNLQLIYH